MQTLVATNEGLAVVAGIVGGLCCGMGWILGYRAADRYWQAVFDRVRRNQPYYREFGDADAG